MNEMGKPGGMVKHSMVIAGHATSISLEEPFWREINRLAHAQGCSVATLVAGVDAERGAANLSSALRLHVLSHLQGQIARFASQNTSYP